MPPFGSDVEEWPELDELSTAWRQDDPTPPYRQIEAPALALWQRPWTPEERYERNCGEMPDDPTARRLMELSQQNHDALNRFRIHDVELFRTEMRNATIIEIPGAAYGAFLSHPGRMEREIRTFLGSQ